MIFPFRVKSHTCSHEGTYKYFFDKSLVNLAILALEKSYGAVEQKSPIGVNEIRCEKFIFRFVNFSNAITVIKTKLCQEDDVLALHVLLNFDAVRTYDQYPDGA